MLKIHSLLLLAFFSVSSFAQVRPITEVFEPQGDFPLETYAKVAVLQWAPSNDAPLGNQQMADQHKASNIATLESYIREAAANGAEFIVTPEFGIVGYPDIPELPSADDNFRNREDLSFYVETIPGKSTDYFAALAKELGVYIQFGMAEKDAITDLYYNAAVVVAPDASLAAKYRKQHLFEIEHHFLEEGDSNVVFDSPFGKVGIVICSDIYHAPALNGYRAAGVDLMTLSTSWTVYNDGWNSFTRGARAMNSVLLAANHDYFPDSGVINADGSTQSHIRQSSGLAYGYVLRK